jgi:hypothetical protein
MHQLFKHTIPRYSVLLFVQPAVLPKMFGRATTTQQSAADSVLFYGVATYQVFLDYAL